MTLGHLHTEILPRYICMCFKIPNSTVSTALPCAVLLIQADKLLSIPLGFQVRIPYPVASSVVKPQRSVSLIRILLDDSYAILLFPPPFLSI